MSRDDLIRLAFAGLHPDRLRALMDRWGTPSRVLKRIESGRIEVPPHARSAVAVPAAKRLAEATEWQGRIVVSGDPGYPRWLQDLPDAPPVLFVRGDLPIVPGVAVVGTRRCTAYGRELAQDFGRSLAEVGIGVISGLAYGIDASAHRGAVDGPGRPIAVLGSGIDHWYPVRHRTLGLSILDAGGAVISEYPPGTHPAPWRFPPRNRIISGLSAVVVVVEAGVTGGALITARCAIEQGRDVFAVPGDVDRESSAGANRLIRDGAWPVFDAADLVESCERVLVGR